MQNVNCVWWPPDLIPSVFDRKISLAEPADSLVDDGPHLPSGYGLHEEVDAVCVLLRAGGSVSRTRTVTEAWLSLFDITNFPPLGKKGYCPVGIRVF